MEKYELIDYWIKSSDKDYQAMIHLWEKGDFTWALFIGHLVVEKLLKAVYVQKTSENPPFLHDLFRLAEKSGLLLDDSQKDLLDTITTFNIKARYDDYKMEFYRKCSKEFTGKWIGCIEELRKWIREDLLNQF
ncbi:MAG: HEPN domain-containing protein [Desulfosalsimonas sp.]